MEGGLTDAHSYQPRAGVEEAGVEGGLTDTRSYRPCAGVEEAGVEGVLTDAHSYQPRAGVEEAGAEGSQPFCSLLRVVKTQVCWSSRWAEYGLADPRLHRPRSTEVETCEGVQSLYRSRDRGGI